MKSEIKRCLALLPILLVRVLVPGQVFHVVQQTSDIINGCSRVVPELFSAVANPAVLAAMQQTRVAFSAEDQWALPGLSFSRGMAVAPVGNGAMALAIQHSGNAAYQESGLGLGYGMKLGKAELGIMLEYRQFQAAEFPSSGFLAAGPGLRVQLLPNLLAGLAFSIPFSPKEAGSEADKPAGNYRIELGFLASEQVSLFAAWVKSDGLAPALDIGIDYAFAAHFFFVTGLHGRTGAPFGKAGWAKNGWRLMLFTAYQPPLGFSPGVGVSFDRPPGRSTKRDKGSATRKGSAAEEKQTKPGLP